VSHVLPYGVERSTEDVDARTRTLRNIRFLLLTRSFKLETSEWSLEPTKTLSTSGGSISSQKESTASERHSMRD